MVFNAGCDVIHPVLGDSGSQYVVARIRAIFAMRTVHKSNSIELSYDPGGRAKTSAAAK